MESSSVNPLRLRSATTAAMVASMFPGFGGGPGRVVGRRTRPLDWNRPHQGNQEIARRRRQIERGQLTASNGLVDTHRVDSHGRVVS